MGTQFITASVVASSSTAPTMDSPVDSAPDVLLPPLPGATEGDAERPDVTDAEGVTEADAVGRVLTMFSVAEP